MAGFTPDPESQVLREHYGVVYAPSRKRKNRFQENCVELFPSQQEAMAAARPAEHRHAAKLYGPSVSSEGHRMYYLMNWLGGE